MICGFFVSACGDDDSPRCGDGIIQADRGEQCDGNTLGGYTCQDVDSSTLGGVLRCFPPGHENECKFDLSLCTRPTCGNNVAEGSQECDGHDLRGQSCIGLGHEAGELRCFGPEDPNPCTYDQSGCLNSPYCGNNQVELDEECDGNDLGGQTCVSLGYLGGNLSCNPDCTFNTNNCQQPVCGNDIREKDEVCDGADLDGETCISRGYLHGTLACEEDCSDFDESDCWGHPVCGDGVIEGNEVCDGDNLAGESCISRGYLEGTLACADDCKSYDESGCTGTNNCEVDHSLGALSPGLPVTVDGDLAGAANSYNVSCTMFGFLGSAGEVVRFTLPQGGGVHVQYELAGMMAMGAIALYSAVTANCDDVELECEDIMDSGNINFEELSPGTYYLIVADDSFMGGGGPYTLVLTASVPEPPEICDNGIDDNGNGLTDCEDFAHCCNEQHCIDDPDYCNPSGSPCTVDTNCAGGVCITEEDYGWPGGFCTSDCSGSGICGAGFECVTYTPQGGTPMDVCVEICTGGGTECRDGYVCTEIGTNLSVCIPNCDDDSDCPDTGECNIESGYCEPVQGLNSTGDECTSPDDCESGMCFTAAPGGYCTSMCNLSDPVCPNGGVCVNYFDTIADDGYCFVACTDVSECRDDVNFQCVENPYYPPPSDLICNWN